MCLASSGHPMRAACCAMESPDHVSLGVGVVAAEAGHHPLAIGRHRGMLPPVTDLARGGEQESPTPLSEARLPTGTAASPAKPLAPLDLPDDAVIGTGAAPYLACGIDTGARSSSGRCIGSSLRTVRHS